ncbi:MAG TPA: transporter substrate-binding domain-containing protein, partial [Bryobacteraceae bacterium]|nr:transporter substrate-binding domain-containing protein [Bryobacteraceae bacterium]
MDIHVRYLAALFLGVVIIPSAGGAADEITSGYTDFPPLFYRDSNGQPGGFAVDVVNRAASEAGVTVRWKWVPRHAVLEAIDRGEIQLYAAALNTDYRRARYHLTRP